MSLGTALASNTVQPFDGLEGFIVCTSLSISYDVMGIATVSYTLMTKAVHFRYIPELYYGGRHFKGYLASIDSNEVPETNGWYENNVTLVCLTTS